MCSAKPKRISWTWKIFSCKYQNSLMWPAKKKKNNYLTATIHYAFVKAQPEYCGYYIF